MTSSCTSVAEAIARELEYLSADTVYARRRNDGSPITGREMLNLLASDHPDALEFVDLVIGAALRIVRIQGNTIGNYT